MSARKLLLDTHVFLWWRMNDARLPQAARAAIEYADAVFVSAASVWEVAIKKARGRLDLPGPMSEGVADSGFEALPITFLHAETAASLPPHHGDPFDRMLVAQAQVEDLVLVTADARLRSYEVTLLAC
jgi:PIN domain nuclease of toxin-antitoxin system